MRLLSAAADLLWGSTCAGCGLPGGRLCAACGDRLVPVPRLAWPDPPPAGLPPPVASAVYAEEVRTMVVAYKERQRLSLARPLGRMLAASVEHLLGTCVPPVFGPVVLVPVPSAPATVQARGHDAVAGLARVAAGRLRRRGTDVRAVRLLHQRRGVKDQAGLGSQDRAANLRGALVARPGPPSTLVVVVDDVITTGSSATEAARALGASGRLVMGVATVAATARRVPAGWRA